MTRSKTIDTVDAIEKNWNLANASDCMPKSLWPENQSDITQWNKETLRLIQVVSEIPDATVKDFRAKLRIAIKARQARNTTTAGRLPYAKVTDLKAVLATYKREEKESGDETIQVAPAPGRTQTQAETFIKAPVTPAAPEIGDDTEEEGYEDSSAPARYGGGIYIQGVKPLKIKINAGHSVPPKPLRRGKKRGCDSNEDGEDKPAERPSIVQEDDDPRDIDATGFLSNLDATPSEIPKKQPRRLSRLQQDLVRVPHWQQDLAPIDMRESAPLARASPGEDDVEMGSVDLGMLTVPANATTQEQLDLWSQRRDILYAAFMVKKLGIQRRAEIAEVSEGADR